MKGTLDKTDCKYYLQHYAIGRNIRIIKVNCRHCVKGMSCCDKCPLYVKVDKSDEIKWFSTKLQLERICRGIEDLNSYIKDFDEVDDVNLKLQ